MKCTIQLVLDNVGQIKVNHIRKLIDQPGDNNNIINHISIANIEIEESDLQLIKNILDKFASSHQPLKLTFNSVGIFMTNNNVLFLSPVITEELLKYKNDLCNQLSEVGIDCGNYFSKENWQPHCTIGLKISDKELMNGLELVKSLDIFPLEVTLDKIDVSKYNPLPFKELYSSTSTQEKTQEI